MRIPKWPLCLLALSLISTLPAAATVKTTSGGAELNCVTVKVTSVGFADDGSANEATVVDDNGVTYTVNGKMGDLPLLSIFEKSYEAEDRIKLTSDDDGNITAVRRFRPATTDPDGQKPVELTRLRR